MNKINKNKNAFGLFNHCLLVCFCFAVFNNTHGETFYCKARK